MKRLLTIIATVLLAAPMLAQDAPVRFRRVADKEKRVAPIHKEPYIDGYGIIWEPEDGTDRYYQRTGMAYYVDPATNKMVAAKQRAHVTIRECADGTLYIKNPVSRYVSDSWIKASRSAGELVIPGGQPMISLQGGVTGSVRWGTFAGSQPVLDSSRENTIRFQMSGDNYVLKNSDAQHYMGLFWDDDDSSNGCGDYSTVWVHDPAYTPAGTDLVTPPDGLATEAWFATGTLLDVNGEKELKRTILVGFDGTDVYVQGLFSQWSTAWVKGTLKDGVATFAKCQFLGYLQWVNSAWAMGLEGSETITDFTMDFDATARTFTARQQLMANSVDDYVEPYCIFRNLVFTADNPLKGPYDVPYANALATVESLNEMTIIDANKDARTWDFSADQSVVRYNYNYERSADDWLVTPGIRLKAGVIYRFATDFKARRASDVEGVEVMMGDAPTAEAMTVGVIERTEIANEKYRTLENALLSVSADGVYYFGIHCVSAANKWELHAANISITEGRAPEGPAAVQNVALVPAADGSKFATIRFDAPSVTLVGSPLTGAVDIELYRGTNLVATTTAEAGTRAVEMTDNVPSVGNYTYTLLTRIGTLEGDRASVSGWVGHDQPLEVKGFALTDNGTSVVASWDAVAAVGTHGGVVVPSATTYNIYKVDAKGKLGERLNAEPIAATSYTFSLATAEGDCALARYAVRAVTEGGTTAGTHKAIVVGSPRDLPLREPFDREMANWWGVTSATAQGSVAIVKDASDGDRGCLSFVSASGAINERVALYSAKLHLAGTQNPMLIFDAKNDAIGSGLFRVYVARPAVAGEEMVLDAPLTDAYEQFRVPLAAYKGDEWVRLVFVADFEFEGSLFMDNVKVCDFLPLNASVSISAPAQVATGTAADITAVVRNDGEQRIDGYKVRIYVNDNLLGEWGVNETDALDYDRKADYCATYEAGIFDTPANLVVRAEVILDGEQQPADNTAEAVLAVTAPVFTPVAEVTAEPSAQGVCISWTPAAETVAERMEDFESYDANTIYTDGTSCGDWLAVDKSQGVTYSWSSSDSAWPHAYKVFAFGVLNFVRCQMEDLFPVHFGDQALIFFSEVNAESLEGQQSDKWLISPLLPGCAQTISFKALCLKTWYGNEHFEVLASQTDTELGSFSRVADFSLLNEEWESLEAVLPEGTKYFAIRYVSNNVFGLFFDDIAFYSMGGEVTGFNVYVDERHVATLPAGTLTYDFTESLDMTTIHHASVTALYGERESAPVTVPFGATAVTDLKASASPSPAYTLSGTRAAKTSQGVTIQEGKKIYR
ncbi:MAG: hypothetical protein HUK01_06935 [Bacteroidaceae bacterium]|nr:hypothetical protein [Bacteroidaceae bacterium]